MLRPSARSKLRGTSAGSGASRQATGSNSERSARSARSSSSAAAAAGSLPVRGRTRPRYLIRSARVQVLFSCWASATAFCAARLSSSWLGTGLRVRASAPVLSAPCHTDGATDARLTPSVRASLSAQPLCSPARSSAPCLALRVLKFDACARCASSRWDGLRPYCFSNRAARTRRSAVIDARREENTRIISPEMPLISKPCPSSRAVHSRPNRRVSASSRCWDTIAATAPTCSL